jgi:phage tail sheath protein FI
VLRDHLFPEAQSLPSSTPPAPPRPRPVQVRIPMRGGGDGARPGVAAYEGDGDDLSGLVAFEGIEDISIVAAPGSTRAAMNGRQSETASIQQLLLGHCERMRYRVAVLDPPDGALVSDIRDYRATMDSTRGALYYPWITIVDPIGGQEMTTPPSGFVAGIYARTDVERGVHKSPANEVVRLAVGFEQLLNKAQQDVLNPEGVNCLRFFEGRGLRVWGARTATSDPEWRYVAVRRFFTFLEHSIDKGTQWAVFEPNGSVLWSRVRRTIEDFLADQWRSGHLMGDKPDEAYFVRCDRSTMTQSDFDNGRLVCLIGVAPLRPAEFVIFRIGQKTLDSTS